jgi:hypothetical protein
MAEMSETMDAARFEALASAYGGRLQNWPEEERTLAQAFARTEKGKAILERANGLDALLDGYAVPAPATALRARILQDARVELAKRRRLRWWWSGFGLAGVGVAGALAGAVLVTVLAPMPKPEHVVFDANTTAFGDVASARAANEEDL